MMQIGENIMTQNITLERTRKEFHSLTKYKGLLFHTACKHSKFTYYKYHHIYFKYVFRSVLIGHYDQNLPVFFQNCKPYPLNSILSYIIKGLSLVRRPVTLHTTINWFDYSCGWNLFL